MTVTVNCPVAIDIIYELIPQRHIHKAVNRRLAEIAVTLIRCCLSNGDTVCSLTCLTGSSLDMELTCARCFT